MKISHQAPPWRGCFITALRWRGVLSLLILALALLFPFHVAGASVVSSGAVDVLDTIVDFSTRIKIQRAAPNQKIAVSVENPVGDIFQIPVETDSAGQGSAFIPAEQLRKAGTYFVRSFSSSSFQVFPGEMNPGASEILSEKTFAAGNERVPVTVHITDEFNNPLAFHEVRLTSSRAQDILIAESSETDEHGEARFTVSSSLSGLSVLTATDETVGETVNQRLSIQFVASQNGSIQKSIGGDPESILQAERSSRQITASPRRGILLAQALPPLARFEIDNLAATVALSSALSFRVKAVDASGNIVPSYTGTVVFSSSDPNAQFPRPYTFIAADQGKKTFDLGLTFRTVGSQIMRLQDESNGLLKGEKSVVVVATPVSTDGPVRITKPATGTYQVNILEVAGEAGPGSRVKIFDNGQQIAEVQTDSAGRFSYTTSLLQDGQHTFTAQSNAVTSTPVSVTIDSTPAPLSDTELSKTLLAPGETFEVTVQSDPNLNRIEALVGEFVTELEQNLENNAVYRGTLTAPAQAGEYPVYITSVDALGNESNPAEVGRVRVDPTLRRPGTVSFNVPSRVTGVSALAGNAFVNLAWAPAQAESGIAFYRIYYGSDQARLLLVTNTRGTGTALTIPNLQNGVPYFFQVTAIDTQGNESDQRSEVVTATPSLNATAVPGSEIAGRGGLAGGGSGLFQNGGGGSDARGNRYPVLCDPGPCPPDAGYPPYTPEDGPEVLGLALASLLGGSALRFLRRKKRQ